MKSAINFSLYVHERGGEGRGERRSALIIQKQQRQKYKRVGSLKSAKGFKGYDVIFR